MEGENIDVASEGGGGSVEKHEDEDGNAEKQKKGDNPMLKHNLTRLPLQIPCLSVPIGLDFNPLGMHWKSLIKPCGNITVGHNAIIFDTPLGKERIPGLDDLKPSVEQAEDFMSQYTLAFAAVLACLWVVSKLTVDRSTTIQSFYDVWNGNLEDIADMTPEEINEERKDKMDPNTPGFIAPGNIYRCLAVNHPGVIGYRRWGQIAFKALISAYMQLYIPYRIMKHTLEDWTLLGIKSPLWFASNAGTFASMMAALLSLCNMFANKCVMNIIKGAEANFYILSHERPQGGGTLSRSTPVEGQGFLAAAPGYVPLNKIEWPQPPRWVIRINEYFWCCLSLAVNISMSFLLQITMFLKVATFTGAVEHVAVVAVSLYFVFDLDDKVLEADDKLKMKYRKEVLSQTGERAYKPKWMPSIAMLSAAILKGIVPIGLLSIILFSWKNVHHGTVIGGDGLTRV